MTDTPNLEISADVLTGIAQLALDKVEGIRSVAPSARVGEILGGRRSKGVQIERNGSDLLVNLTVAVEYGVEIPIVGSQVQHEVREAITAMTGFSVHSVNLKVESIDLPAEAPRG